MKVGAVVAGTLCLAVCESELLIDPSRLDRLLSAEAHRNGTAPDTGIHALSAHADGTVRLAGETPRGSRPPPVSRRGSPYAGFCSVPSSRPPVRAEGWCQRRSR